MTKGGKSKKDTHSPQLSQEKNLKSHLNSTKKFPQSFHIQKVIKSSPKTPLKSILKNSSQNSLSPDLRQKDLLSVKKKLSFSHDTKDTVSNSGEKASNPLIDRGQDVQNQNEKFHGLTPNEIYASILPALLKRVSSKYSHYFSQLNIEQLKKKYHSIGINRHLGALLSLFDVDLECIKNILEISEKTPENNSILNCIAQNTYRVKMMLQLHKKFLPLFELNPDFFVPFNYFPFKIFTQDLTKNWSVNNIKKEKFLQKITIYSMSANECRSQRDLFERKIKNTLNECSFLNIPIDLSPGSVDIKFLFYMFQHKFYNLEEQIELFALLLEMNSINAETFLNFVYEYNYDAEKKTFMEEEGINFMTFQPIFSPEHEETL